MLKTFILLRHRYVDIKLVEDINYFMNDQYNKMFYHKQLRE